MGRSARGKRGLFGSQLRLEQLEQRWLLTTLPAGFSESFVAGGLVNATAMTFMQDGRLLVAEKGGTLRVIDNTGLRSQPMLTLNVDNNDERGLLGVAVDPNFSANPFVYVFYTVPSGTVHNRVSRFTVSANTASLASEQVLIDMDQVDATSHNAGAIHFGGDGKLYIATGDNTNTSNSQTLANTHGKILRINSNGSIPTDNPFFTTTTGNNRAIWALGLRNPFTFAVQPGTGRVFINDVGQFTWEEINEGFAGANFGWPATEGETTDPRFDSPLFAYGHGEGGALGCAITGGTFYNPVTNTFPSDYQGDYFFADFCNSWIRRYDPITDTVQNFATNTSIFVVDLAVSSSGSLYYLSRGNLNNGQVYKIDFSATPVAPSIVQQPQDELVSVGQSATFSVSASGSQPLSYQWQRNGVNIPGATETSYTLASPGTGDNNDKFRVLVTNGAGTVASTAATLSVTTNAEPVVTIENPASGSFYRAGDTINFSGSANDPETGAIGAANLTWRVDFHHNTHTHPFLPPTSGISSGSFVIPTLGETSADVFYRVYLTARDPIGLETTAFRDILPRTSTVTIDSSPPGLRLTLDGQPIVTPFSFVGVEGITRTLGVVPSQSAGGANYEFVRWSDGGGAIHNISTPTSDTRYTATFRQVQGFGFSAGQGSSTPNDEARSIVVDSAGNSYIAGSLFYADGAADLFGAGAGDAFFAKLSPTGTVLWQNQIGSSGDDRALAAAVDANGNMYVGGTFQGTVDFDPGNGIFNLTSSGGYDGFVAKYNQKGSLLWAGKFGGNSATPDAALGLAIRGTDVLVTGLFGGTVDFNPGTGVTNLTSAGSSDAFALVLTSAGTLRSARRWGGSGADRGTAIATDSSGNIYTTGSFTGTADFNPGTGVQNRTSAGGTDVFALRLSSTGVFSLIATIGGSLDDEGADIEVAADGSIYMTGHFRGTADFDPQAGVRNLVSAGQTDIFLSRLNSTGSLAFANAMGGAQDDRGRGLAVLSNGSVAVIGHFGGTVDFNPGTAVANLTSKGDLDIFVAGYTSTGQFISGVSYGASGTDIGRSIARGPNDVLLIAGGFTGSVTFNTGSGTFPLVSSGGRDIFAAKLIVSAPTATNQSFSTQSFAASEPSTAAAISEPSSPRSRSSTTRSAAPSAADAVFAQRLSWLPLARLRRLLGSAEPKSDGTAG